MTEDSEEAPNLEEVRERILGHVPEGISPQEATDLLREVRNFVVEEDTWELAPVLEDESYLVLGSYDEETGEKCRLRAVVEVLETAEDSYAFLLEDIELTKDRPEISRYKFKLIADYSDHLVGVFEREYGGETHDITLIVEEYLSRSQVFVREFGSEGDRIEYGWMTEGFFYDFEMTGHLHYWNKKEDLLESVYEVFLDS